MENQIQIPDHNVEIYNILEEITTKHLVRARQIFGGENNAAILNEINETFQWIMALHDSHLIFTDEEIDRIWHNFFLTREYARAVFLRIHAHFFSVAGQDNITKLMNDKAMSLFYILPETIHSEIEYVVEKPKEIVEYFSRYPWLLTLLTLTDVLWTEGQ